MNNINRRFIHPHQDGLSFDLFDLVAHPAAAALTLAISVFTSDGVLLPFHLGPNRP